MPDDVQQPSGSAAVASSGVNTKRDRRTRIVATLGPSSATPKMIRTLFEVGADVFRLNFSHGSHEDHRQRIEDIRNVEAEVGCPISILMDLQGPKLRIGTFANSAVELVKGEHFRLDADRTPGDEGRVNLPHPEIFSSIGAGSELLLDDGKIRLRVEACDGASADTTVVTGGLLSNAKGVNVPDSLFSVSALTDKDRRDLEFGLGLGVDWVALSFVQRPEDVAEVRKLIAGRASLLSKMEKPSAIDHLEEIIDLSDAIMVARGDLGVELPPEDVPGLQKRIVTACRCAGKPVVVATQMLESMIHAPAPTRAEAADVATAVDQGSDAVMLSAETAAGEYPVEAVEMMDRIIRRTELDPLCRNSIEATRIDPEETSEDAVSVAARQIAQTISAAAIVTYTSSGATTLRAARERPTVPIVALTPNRRTARQLVLAWGVHCVHKPDPGGVTDVIGTACKCAVNHGFARQGDQLVIIAGLPFGTPGATNLIHIASISREKAAP